MSLSYSKTEEYKVANINDSKKTAKLWNIDEKRVYSNFNQFIKVEKNLIDAVANSTA